VVEEWVGRQGATKRRVAADRLIATLSGVVATRTKSIDELAHCS